MEESGNYEELQRQYLELQARVTRFSATQQELINTKDRLDQELVRYKRLNQFFSMAIRQVNILELLSLTAEAIIDIFELQIGYLQFTTFNEDGLSEELIFCEGASSNHKDLIAADFKTLEAINIFSGNFKQFDEDEIQLYTKDSKLFFALLSKKLLFGPNATLVIGAGVDILYKDNYSTRESTKISLFTIFVNQVEAIINNLITLNKNKEQFLRIKRSELELKKLSLIATSTHNTVIITDDYGRIEWVNDAFTKMSGYDIQEVKGLKPKDFLQVKDDRTKEARNLLSAALNKKESVEVEIINLNKSGNEYYIKLQVTPVFSEEGKLINFVALQKDITQEVLQRMELEKMNFRLNEITKGSKVGIWEFFPETGEATWNEVLYELYETQDYPGKNLHQFWRDALHPDDRDRVLSGISEIILGKKRKNIEEYRVLVGSEKKVKYVRTIAFAEKNTSNELKILGSTTDITDSKNYENQLIRNNEELKKINSELDQFVYSVSHDLRSPLLSVKGLLSLIKLAEGDHESEQFMGLIQKSINRLDATVLEILEYSRNSRKELEISSFDLNNLTQSIFEDLGHLSEKNIELSVFDHIKEPVNLDLKRIEKLLYNLISNGIKYKDNSKEQPFVHVHLHQSDTEYIIEVLDNGEGISPENQKKVFDMFYRASVSASGTGLGLYLCKELVSKMNGKISLESEAGKGTKITVTLPRLMKVL